MYAKSTWVIGGVPSLSSANLNNLEDQYNKSVVIGEIVIWAGTTAPTDFLLCNGTSASNLVYPSLFTVTSYNFGGSSTWFNLPNLMGKYTAGLGTGDYSTMGKIGGSSEVTLTVATMPSHLHTIDAYTTGSWGPRLTGVGNAALSTNTNYVGGDLAHENRPQSIVMNFIIRYQ